MSDQAPQQSLSESYLQRFGGIARLYGEPALRKLHQGHFVVVGVGGVGSWTAESLVRTGIGEITLIDLDDICITNSNRQLHTLHSTIGQSKIAVLAARLREINPEVVVHEVEDFIQPENLDELITAEQHVVIDAIDSAFVKAHLIHHCRRLKQQVITVGSAGGKRDPSRIISDDLRSTVHDPLLSKLRKRLRQHHHFPRNPKRNFGVEAVYSAEQMVFPSSDGGVCQTKGDMQGGVKLDCSGGFGAATMVTATFGMVAAARAVDRYLKAAT